VIWLFFEIVLRSASSIESSRRDLSNDETEDRYILKNNQNTYCPVSFTLKTGIAFLKTGVLFLLCVCLSLPRINRRASRTDHFLREIYHFENSVFGALLTSMLRYQESRDVDL